MGDWPRGLAAADDRIYVGLSVDRHGAGVSRRASVRILDRRSWQLLEAIDLPASEVYDLLLVPAGLVAGTMTGLATGFARVHGPWGVPAPRVPVS